MSLTLVNLESFPHIHLALIAIMMNYHQLKIIPSTSFNSTGNKNNNKEDDITTASALLNLGTPR